VFCVPSPEIVSWREANKDKSTVDTPEIDNPAFRALVEENVKDSVSNIIASPVMQQRWTAFTAQENSQNSTSTPQRRADSGAPLKPVYVHGESTLFFSTLPPASLLGPISRTWTRLTHGFWLFSLFPTGFVYDISTGEVMDLGVSFGPHGPTSQAPPQGAVKRAIDEQVHGHAHL